MEWNRINDRISYLKSQTEPLSADVIRINGDENVWIFDVGNSNEAFEKIKAIEGHKNIVLSHFHADHVGNVGRLMEAAGDEITLFVSRQTQKYTQKYTQTREGAEILVESEMLLNDGIDIRIVPMPSSHSKGCLVLEVDGEYAFLGDSAYPMQKDEKRVYNVQKLKEQMNVVNGLQASKLYLSHEERPVIAQKAIAKFLESVYEKRNSQDVYIELKEKRKLTERRAYEWKSSQ